MQSMQTICNNSTASWDQSVSVAGVKIIASSSGSFFANEAALNLIQLLFSSAGF